MKQFEATFTISIKSDGLDEIEAKIQQFIKNNNLEGIAMDLNATLEIDSNVELNS